MRSTRRTALLGPYGLAALLTLFGCGEPDEEGLDRDDDGYTVEDGDCDDGDPAVHPGVHEYCDGLDNDCDGDVDDGEAIDAEVYYADEDGDGFGNVRFERRACSAPEGFVSDATDCDDADGSVHPGAAEVCDGADNDCDGQPDDGLPETVTWYRDRDDDGFGDPETTVVACIEPEGFVTNGEDCDDREARARPDGEEVCDGIDNDCDGETDDAAATDATPWYGDADEDGHGDPEAPAVACSQPEGTVAVGDDCDDGDPDVNPDAVEACDGIDNDCNDEVDEEGATGERSFYRDADGDGHGVPDDTATACAAPEGYAAEADDCDDGDGTRYPGADEICINDVDEDCDSVPDDGCVVDHCDPIAESETWEARFVHHVTCDLFVQGASSPVLTIEDGALVTFEPETGLYAGFSGTGSIVVDGVTSGVAFSSAAVAPAAGDYDGLNVGSWGGASVLRGLTITSAGGGASVAGLTVSGAAPVVDACTVTESGGDGLLVTAGGAPEVTGSTFSDNLGDGVRVEATAGLARGAGPTFAGNVLTANRGHGMTLPAAFVDELDPSSSFVGNDLEGIRVLGDTLEADALWPALDEPYVVAGDVVVNWSTSPHLTIADGVEIRFEAGTRLEAGWSGAGWITVDGRVLGVTFTSAATVPAPGDWEGLSIGMWGDGSVLTGLRVEWAGGAALGSTGAIHVAHAEVALEGCSVTGSAAHGLYAELGAELTVTGSTFADNVGDGLRLTGASLAPIGPPSFTGNGLARNGGYGVALPADSAGELDASSSFVGNGLAGVLVEGGPVTRSATWQALDTPVVVEGMVRVASAARPVLTVAPGATLLFEPAAGIEAGVAGDGSMRAEGTAALPIRFGSAAAVPAAGDWAGVVVGTFCDDATALFDHVTIEHGGGSGAAASLTFAGCDGGLDHAVVRGSASWGVTCTGGASPSIGAVTYADNAAGDDGCS